MYVYNHFLTWDGPSNELYVVDRIAGSGDYSASEQIGVLNREIPNDNMFTTSRDEDKKFEVRK